jgi:hypothetical protein
MLTDYFIIVAATSALTLIWRALKDDHPRFKQWIADLPFIGEALSCGFCAAMWFSLAAVLFANPLATYQTPFSVSFGVLLPLANRIVAWLTVGTAVLFTRSLIIVLLELGGNLKHQHRSRH